MRRMKKSAARITPTLTATTRSTNTVSKNVIKRTPTSSLGAPRTRRTTWGNSLMFQETTNSTADSEHSGIAEANGANRTMTRIKNTECTMPARGLLAPLRMLVAVRATAPVAAKPPNSGATMLAMPWPINS